MKAHDFLEKAVSEMKARADLRDASATGERSMAATVAAFNAVRKKELTEEDGWAFMVLLKLVRSSKGKYHADDYIDGAAYFGLLGECAEPKDTEPKDKDTKENYQKEEGPQKTIDPASESCHDEQLISVILKWMYQFTDSINPHQLLEYTDLKNLYYNFTKFSGRPFCSLQTFCNALSEIGLLSYVVDAGNDIEQDMIIKFNLKLKNNETNRKTVKVSDN